MLFIVFLSFFIRIIQSELLLNIPTAFVNVKSVISCGPTIDIYSSFDPDQVSICPHVSIDKQHIQLIHMNICIRTKIFCFPFYFSLIFIISLAFDQRTNQIVIYSKPSLKSSPRFLTKLSNNSFISPTNFTSKSNFYLVFSSNLICRISFQFNQTICFYYLQSTDLIRSESQYDNIQRGGLILPSRTKMRFYTVFFLMAMIVFLVCSFSLALLCTKEFSLRETSKLDWIIDTRMVREEVAKRSAGETRQDGGVTYQHTIVHSMDG